MVTNILAPYRVRLFESIARRCSDFLVVVLADSHRNRAWSRPKTGFDTHRLAGMQFSIPGSVDPMHVNIGAWAVLRKFSPDAVLGGGYTPAHLESFAYCAVNRKIYVPWGELVTSHATQSRLLRRIVRRLMIGRSRACIASSTATREAFEFYGARRDRILVSLMPVGTRDVAARAEASRVSGAVGQIRSRHSTPVFLAVSRLVDEKGLPQLLRAFAAVQFRLPAATLLIAGDGPNRGAYQRAASDLALRNVEFLGHLPPEKLAGYYAAADVFVFPTLHDTYGAVIPEAMAAQTIVVSSTHAAAARDFVVDQETGFLEDPLDIEQFASCMLTAAALSPDKRIAMLARASKLVAHDDYETSAAEIVHFITRTLGDQTRASHHLPSRERS